MHMTGHGGASVGAKTSLHLLASPDPGPPWPLIHGQAVLRVLDLHLHRRS